MTKSNTLALQAIHQYDLHGEQAMINFMHRNRDPHQDPGESRESGLFRLSDHTTIELWDNRYHAFYLETVQGADPRQPGIRPMTETRPAAIDPQDHPDFASTPTPLLHWPDCQSLWKAVMTTIQPPGEQPRDAARGGCLPITREDTSWLAPGLEDTIRQVMESHWLPDHLLRAIELELHACAQNVVNNLSQEDQQALHQALAQRAQTESPEA